MAKKYDRNKAMVRKTLGRKGKDVRRYNKNKTRQRKKARRDLLNLGSDQRLPKAFRTPRLEGAGRLR